MTETQSAAYTAAIQLPRHDPERHRLLREAGYVCYSVKLRVLAYDGGPRNTYELTTWELDIEGAKRYAERWCSSDSKDGDTYTITALT